MVWTQVIVLEDYVLGLEEPSKCVFETEAVNYEAAEVPLFGGSKNTGKLAFLQLQNVYVDDWNE